MRTKLWYFSIAALALDCLLLFGFTFAQQTGEGAASQGSLLTPPKVNIVDIAARAGPTAKTVAVDGKGKKYIYETTRDQAASSDYNHACQPVVILGHACSVAEL